MAALRGGGVPVVDQHHQQNHDEMMLPPVRIGIDFGGTIGTLERGASKHAFFMIRHLVHKFGACNVFVLSKAGPRMEQRIRQWLQDQGFYASTGVVLRNVLFVREYQEKAIWVQRLGISIFFDDHIKNVSSLLPLESVQRVFWMHADKTSLQHIRKQWRHKIALTNDWAKTMKYFQKIPRNRNKEGPNRRVTLACD